MRTDSQTADAPPGSVQRLVRRFVRWKYVVLTYRDYHNRLNRSVDVESVLWSVSKGRRGPLTADECHQLAMKLGVPDEFRSPNS